MKSIGIYIHIPFCERKCLYCDFNSYSGKKELISEYLEGLKQEIRLHKGMLEGFEAESIYIGGGTPSLLSGKALESIMMALKENIRIKAGAEISMEANPGTLNKENLKGYFNSGINRLSMGLQACQDKLLSKLGRIHSYQDFLNNLEDARAVGFSNINVDLMFALPGQGLKEWEVSLMKLIGLDIPHISAYSLIWEEGTALEGLRDKSLLSPADEELELAMFHTARSILKNSGYNYYEISNYAKPDFECRHNIVYWKNQSYVGMGAGAHSYFNNRRYSNETTIEGYLKAIDKMGNPVKEVIEVSRTDEISETMFLGLRMTKGINIEDFKHRFGVTPMEVYPNILPKLKADGLILYNDEKIALTDRGIDLANLVFQELLID